DEHCDKNKHLGKLNLIGDGFHNIIDGLILISAFSVDIKFGWSILLAIALHEIVQEIGDFGILLYAGYTKSKALIYNFISASTILIGVILGYFLINNINNINIFLLPFAAGGFIYIATSDIIPELHKEINFKKSFLSFVFFVLGLVIMYNLT
ncbi:ZIP family metal transporter, partial [Patescibacteria group bacterium]